MRTRVLCLLFLLAACRAWSRVETAVKGESQEERERRTQQGHKQKQNQKRPDVTQNPPPSHEPERAPKEAEAEAEAEAETGEAAGSGGVQQKATEIEAGKEAQSTSSSYNYLEAVEAGMSALSELASTPVGVTWNRLAAWAGDKAAHLRTIAGAALDACSITATLLLDEIIRLYASGRPAKHLQAVCASLRATSGRLVVRLEGWGAHAYRAGAAALEWCRRQSHLPWGGWEWGGAAYFWGLLWAGAARLWEHVAALGARAREAALPACAGVMAALLPLGEAVLLRAGPVLACAHDAIEAQPWAFALTVLSILTASLLLMLLLPPRGSARSPLSSAFFSLGLGYRDAKVLILGPDNAGKTTLLLMLKEGRVVIPTRTKAPNRTELVLGRTRLRAVDLGGHETARAAHPWERFMDKTVGGIVFVVDAAAPARLPQARRELGAILQSAALGSRVPVVVLGNKIDLGVAMSEADLRAGLGLEEGSGSGGAGCGIGAGAGAAAGGEADIKLPVGKGPEGSSEGPRPVKVFMCSFVHKMGYGEGLVWMIDHF